MSSTLRSLSRLAPFVLLSLQIAMSNLPHPDGVRVQSPYNVQVQLVLARLAKCSPATYQSISREVTTVEFFDPAEEQFGATVSPNGYVSLFHPWTIFVSKRIMTDPDSHWQAFLPIVLAHEARHLYQLRDLGWWLELRNGYDDWQRMKENDAIISQMNVIHDCEATQ